MALTFLRKLNIDPEKTVLDVGTGTGFLIPHIFSFHPAWVIALDLSAGMLSIHNLIRQDLPDPAMILSETIACHGFHVTEWRDDSTEYYLIAEKI